MGLSFGMTAFQAAYDAALGSLKTGRVGMV